MTVHINIAKAKATLSELIARAEAGEEVVLTRNGKPVASLVRTAPEVQERRPGAFAHLGKLTPADSFSDVDTEFIQDADSPDEDPFYN
jgi:prevent-host-death family protein